MVDTSQTKDAIISSKIKALAAVHQQEIATRNQYITRRDDYIYGTALTDSITFPNGFDKTQYNWLERVVDIHTSQLFGRDVRFYSTYNKRDLSIAQDLEDPKQLQQDQMLNKRLKANADARNEFIVSLIKDNGGAELWQLGAQSGSAFGFSVYKSWMGDKEKVNQGKDIPWHIELVENIQNFIALWSSDNFRETDGYLMTYQISPLKAAQDYGKYLPADEVFSTEPLGTPLTDNPVPPVQAQGQQPMVRVTSFVGFLDGIKGGTGDTKNELYTCQPGEETEVYVRLVGDRVVSTITEDDELPRYYIVPNQKIMRRPWGFADVNETCIEINRTVVQRMSDWVTMQDKTLFTKYKGINFDSATVPRPTPRTTEVFPMEADQNIAEIGTNMQYENAYPAIISKLEENFVRAARISRVLFDDPQVSADSNAALMTTMKGTIDAVEKKQKIWQAKLVPMLEDALRTLAKHYDNVKPFVEGDEAWSLNAKWPSVLRKEDPAYQTMLLNQFNAGGMSVDTLLEENGSDSPGEELDRIRDNMKDPVTAAIMGKRLADMAEVVIAPLRFIPKMPIRQAISWKAVISPEQAANVAVDNGWQQGPYGASVVKQDPGSPGAGTPEPVGQKPAAVPSAAPAPGAPAPAPSPASASSSPPAPQALPGENQPGTGPVSQPGSGAPAPVSPAGAIAQANQRRGA